MPVRPARAEELTQLTQLALRSKASWGYSAAFMQACRAELTVRAEHLPHVFVDEADGSTLLGFYALSRSDAQRAELEFLFVEPAQLRRGVGRRLVRHALELARSWGCDRIVIQGDPHALAFYRALGAVQSGERASDSIPGRRLPVLELRC